MAWRWEVAGSVRSGKLPDRSGPASCRTRKCCNLKFSGTVWCKQISPCSVIRQKQKNSPIVFRLGKLQSKLHCPVLSSSIAWIFSMGATVKEVVCTFFGFFFFFPFFFSSLLYSIAVRRITSAKGTIWQSTSQMSIILMSEVGGRPSILLMKMANRHIPTSQKPTMVGFWQ